MNVFVVGTSNLQRREGRGDVFILVPQKLAIMNYPVENITYNF
jgi:hypothetical protein